MHRVVRKEPAIIEIVCDPSGKVIAEMQKDFMTDNPDVIEKLRARGYTLEEVKEEAEIVPEEPKQKPKRGK